MSPAVWMYSKRSVKTNQVRIFPRGFPSRPMTEAAPCLCPLGCRDDCTAPGLLSVITVPICGPTPSFVCYTRQLEILHTLHLPHKTQKRTVLTKTRQNERTERKHRVTRRSRYIKYHLSEGHELCQRELHWNQGHTHTQRLPISRKSDRKIAVNDFTNPLYLRTIHGAPAFLI